jgi:hypothetical protein
VGTAAISYHGDDQDAIHPEVKKKDFDERDWERVREAVLAVYG